MLSKRCFVFFGLKVLGGQVAPPECLEESYIKVLMAHGCMQELLPDIVDHVSGRCLEPRATIRVIGRVLPGFQRDNSKDL